MPVSFLEGNVHAGEDEIASIGFCIGASMAGLKAMTATSRPRRQLLIIFIVFGYPLLDKKQPPT